MVASCGRWPLAYTVGPGQWVWGRIVPQSFRLSGYWTIGPSTMTINTEHTIRCVQKLGLRTMSKTASWDEVRAKRSSTFRNEKHTFLLAPTRPSATSPSHSQLAYLHTSGIPQCRKHPIRAPRRIARTPLRPHRATTVSQQIMRHRRFCRIAARPGAPG